MAKRSRSGRPQSGGRVTPKGQRPAGATKASRSPARVDAVPRGVDPVRTRMPAAPHVPMRAGHHRGQR